jgi:hypothetical protein
MKIAAHPDMKFHLQVENFITGRIFPVLVKNCKKPTSCFTSLSAFHCDNKLLVWSLRE